MSPSTPPYSLPRRGSLRLCWTTESTSQSQSLESFARVLQFFWSNDALVDECLPQDRVKRPRCRHRERRRGDMPHRRRCWWLYLLWFQPCCRCTFRGEGMPHRCMFVGRLPTSATDFLLRHPLPPIPSLPDRSPSHRQIHLDSPSHQPAATRIQFEP